MRPTTAYDLGHARLAELHRPSVMRWPARPAPLAVLARWADHPGRVAAS